MNGSLSIRELASKLGLGYSRSATILRGLIKNGYCEKCREGEAFPKREEELAPRYDTSLLLEGMGEKLLPVPESQYL